MSLKPRSWRVSIALSISVALVVSIFAGVVVDPPVSRDSVWDWVRSWFIGTALADGAGVPVQDGGTAAGPQAQVPARLSPWATWPAPPCEPIGTGPNGGSQSQVRVSMNGKDEIHGTPWGPER